MVQFSQYYCNCWQPSTFGKVYSCFYKLWIKKKRPRRLRAREEKEELNTSCSSLLTLCWWIATMKTLTLCLLLSAIFAVSVSFPFKYPYPRYNWPISRQPDYDYQYATTEPPPTPGRFYNPWYVYEDLLAQLRSEMNAKRVESQSRGRARKQWVGLKTLKEADECFGVSEIQILFLSF